MEKNWAGNLTYSASKIETPKSLEALQTIVRDSVKVKTLGSRHSFNNIADCPETLICLKHFSEVLSIDPEVKTISADGGITYGQLCEPLFQAGLALPNLASLPHISVVGACTTATHGSGLNNQNLAAAVCGLELVKANGEVLECSQQTHGDHFKGMVVGLGGLGVISKVTLAVEETFDVRQRIYENLALSALKDHFEAVMGSAYSVSLFTHWDKPVFHQVWLKERMDGSATDSIPEDLFGATLATQQCHPIEGGATEASTQQAGVPGPWHHRLPHFKMEFTPSFGEELQSEYFVPIEHAYEALEAMHALGAQIAPALLISEIRTIAADELWMSPCYQQPCMAIHFTWKPDWPLVRSVLPKIESALEPFNARPHWGKLFTMSPAKIRTLYPKLAAFRDLLKAYDTDGKFQNAFLEKYVGAAD